MYRVSIELSVQTRVEALGEREMLWEHECGVSPENSLDDRNGKTKTNNNIETNND